MGHGTTNSTTLAGLDPQAERDTVATILGTIEAATGRRPRGWLGSGLVETFDTLDILAAEGVVYWATGTTTTSRCRLKVKSGKMFGIPYCNELNDIPLYLRKGYTGEQYLRSVIDQFDVLYADSSSQPRVLGLPLHPMISGQPLRIRYLERAIAHMKVASGRVVRDRKRDHRGLPESGVTGRRHQLRSRRRPGRLPIRWQAGGAARNPSALTFRA